MSANIYIGNLPLSATSEAIQALFNLYGAVETVNLITHPSTGKPRGFGFVKMTSGANEAIAALHEKDFEGRTLTVSRAKPRDQRPRQPQR